MGWSCRKGDSTSGLKAEILGFSPSLVNDAPVNREVWKLLRNMKLLFDCNTVWTRIISSAEKQNSKVESSELLFLPLVSCCNLSVANKPPPPPVMI
jgi:hypothetical protein